MPPVHPPNYPSRASCLSATIGSQGARRGKSAARTSVTLLPLNRQSSSSCPDSSSTEDERPDGVLPSFDGDLQDRLGWEVFKGLYFKGLIIEGRVNPRPIYGKMKQLVTNHINEFFGEGPGHRYALSKIGLWLPGGAEFDRLVHCTGYFTQTYLKRVVNYWTVLCLWWVESTSRSSNSSLSTR